MKTVLQEKLWAYIVHNNPDLLLELQEQNSVTAYLDEKVAGILPQAQQMLSVGTPAYEMEEFCLNAMTEELRPSKYLYVLSVLQEEFPKDFERIAKTGILVHEVLNMLYACRQTFEDLEFSQASEDDRHIRYAIIAKVHEYLT